LFFIIRKIIFLTILSLLFFSCASAKAPLASSESGETARRAGSESDDRMIAYSVSLELAVKNTGETRKALIEQVPKNNGFIVRDTDNYITARIPAEKMEDFLKNARTLGKIENETKRERTLQINTVIMLFAWRV